MSNKNSKSPTTKTITHSGHEYDPSVKNWTEVSFPSDPIGLTTRLRSEFRDAIQHCHGSDDKFQQVVDNPEVLIAWAEAKIAADKEANKRAAEVAAAWAAEHERRETFKSRTQTGPGIRVSATATGFVEVSAHDGSVLADYDTADDEAGRIASFAQMMIAEGRNPNSRLDIDAFGRPSIGSGQTLAGLAGSPTSTEAPIVRASGGLQAIKA